MRCTSRTEHYLCAVKPKFVPYENYQNHLESSQDSRQDCRLPCNQSVLARPHRRHQGHLAGLTPLPPPRTAPTTAEAVFSINNRTHPHPTAPFRPLPRNANYLCAVTSTATPNPITNQNQNHYASTLCISSSNQPKRQRSRAQNLPGGKDTWLSLY